MLFLSHKLKRKKRKKERKKYKHIHEGDEDLSKFFEQRQFEDTQDFATFYKEKVLVGLCYIFFRTYSVFFLNKKEGERKREREREREREKKKLKHALYQNSKSHFYGHCLELHPLLDKIRNLP